MHCPQVLDTPSANKENLTLEIAKFGESATDGIFERYSLKEELFLAEILPHSGVLFVAYYIDKWSYSSSLDYP